MVQGEITPVIQKEIKRRSSLKEAPNISVIIPVYNEASTIGKTIHYVKKYGGASIHEIIVVDGGSADQTEKIIVASGATPVKSAIKSRAFQMNRGASVSSGDILYFLHADTLPPMNFADHIIISIQKGFTGGCYQLSFDYNHWFLKINCWFTKFDIDAFRFGDQSLFIQRDQFHKITGFKENLLLMEDQEIIHRIKQVGTFEVLDGKVITSARKYITNGIYKLQFLYLLINILYRCKIPQKKLYQLYQYYIK